jgi:hypothetical protein
MRRLFTMKLQYEILEKIAIASQIQMSPLKKEEIWNNLESQMNKPLLVKPNKYRFAFFSSRASVIASILIILITMLSIASVGNADNFFKLIWSGGTMQTGTYQNSQYDKPLIPLDIVFQNNIKSAKQKLDLTESRKTADFPIRDFAKLDDWSRIQAIGLMIGGRFGIHSLYSNSKEQKILVLQSYVHGFSGSFFPKDSTVVEGFNDDFAVLMVRQKAGRKDLMIFHKQTPDQTIQITFTADNLDDSTLESFAHSFLQNK